MVCPNGHIWVTEECPPGLWQAWSSGAASAGSGSPSSPLNTQGLEQIFASIIMAVQGDDLWLLLDVCNPFGDKICHSGVTYLGEVQKEINCICSLNKLAQ